MNRYYNHIIYVYFTEFSVQPKLKLKKEVNSIDCSEQESTPILENANSDGIDSYETYQSAYRDACKEEQRAKAKQFYFLFNFISFFNYFILNGFF